MPAQHSRTLESRDCRVILEIDKEKWVKRNEERVPVTPTFPLLASLPIFWQGSNSAYTLYSSGLDFLAESPLP